MLQLRTYTTRQVCCHTRTLTHTVNSLTPAAAISAASAQTPLQISSCLVSAPSAVTSASSSSFLNCHTSHRLFSTRAPRRNVVPRTREERKHPPPKHHSKEQDDGPHSLNEALEPEVEHILHEEHEKHPESAHDTFPVRITLEATKADAKPIRIVSAAAANTTRRDPIVTPQYRDAHGRHEIRTKLHPAGAVVGRGRVVANFGTRMLVQEVPWEMHDEAGKTLTNDHNAASNTSSSSSSQQHVDGARFICMPRGKLGKIVCGDIVLWEWSSQHSDSAAFIVELLPRQTEFRRVDKATKGGQGREQVLLASNFHHICIICAPRPATNGMLLDRYLAAAQRMGVGASIIFNKMDLKEEAARFREDMNDFRRIGVKVIETCTTKGKEIGIEELRQHLATNGPDGKPGITIFVGQSGSGKSSLLNALSPSLQLAVNDLSKNHQGRHTTTQTILHQLESGGEIIDSPGFQNYVPPAIELNEVALGFVEFIEPAKLCHYGARCRHISEPGCGVRMAVRGTSQDQDEALRKLNDSRQEEMEKEQPAVVDQRAVMAAAFQNALAAQQQGLSTPLPAINLLPDDPDSPLTKTRNAAQHEKHRAKDWENPTRRQRQAEIDQLTIENRAVHMQVAQPELRTRDPMIDGDDVMKPDSAKVYAKQKQYEIAQELATRGLLDTISKRRYDSYRMLIEQQKEREAKKYA